MQQATVNNQRYADRNIERAEPIQQENSRFIARWRKSIECQQETHEPENRVDSFDGELCSSEEKREEGDVSCYS